MVKLMKTGQYDAVSASGDASLRLIASGDAAPVNTRLVPNYKDVFAGLKDGAWNSVDGQMYGIPHGRGANLLMYNTEKVKPAPTSWSAVFDDASRYKGRVTAYDSPIYLADAALYLKATEPELGIKNPYALDRKQFDAAVALLKRQNADIGEYWSDYLKEVSAFRSGDSVVGTTWQVIANLAADEGAPVEAVVPKEGSTGWSDTWMVSAKAKHPNCAYKWLDWIVSPEVNAQVAEYFGEAPSNAKACDETSDKNFCTTFHAADTAYWKNIAFWNTPIEQCLDGRSDVKCVPYAKWVQAWTEIKG
jgi:putative spermidine/putrescine transport system substrate-binding protein